MRIFGLILALLLVGCESSTPINKEFDKTNNPVEVTVIVYPNEKRVSLAYAAREIENGALESDPMLRLTRYGWSEWDRPGGKKESCRIHVVELNRGDDQRMMTLGHEMAHCIYGKWHTDSATGELK
jgi:hypothetical protein